MIALIFFSFIFLFGFITSYEDIWEGRIRNKYILSAFVFAFLVNSLMFSGFIGDNNLSQDYYLALLINVIIAFLVGFALWMFNLWTPGDAKLFSAYAALIPLTTYQLGYNVYFPSFTLFSNTFIPLFLLMLFTAPFSIKNPDRGLTRDLFNIKKMADRMIFLFGFLWFFNVFFSYLGIHLTFLLYLLLFMAIPYVFKRIRFISLTHASMLLSILRLIFDANTVFTRDFLIFFISLVFVFVIVMLLIDFSGFLKTTASVDIKNLRQGMVLAKKIVSGDKIFFKADEEITEKDVELLNELYAGGKLKSDVVDVQQSLPFAPFLFFGVLLTYLCQGDLIVFLRILYAV
jgi:Flp pilus assembly protein protease CpaA